MSVYIKGMEMPKNCWSCAFMDGEYGYCVIDGLGRDAEEKTNCPLIPIPNHGRLIEADALTYVMGMDEHFSPLEAMYLIGLVADATTIIPGEEVTE